MILNPKAEIKRWLSIYHSQILTRLTCERARLPEQLSSPVGTLFRRLALRVANELAEALPDS